MKHAQNKLVIIFLSLIISTNVHAWGAKRPTTPAEPTTPTTPVPPTTPTAPPVTSTPEPTGTYIEQVASIAGSSTCASYSWKNRGKAPSGYIKGMALSFARGVCRLKASEATPASFIALLSSARTTNTTKDALAYYQTNISSLGIETSSSGREPLRALYTLGIGLGMRESSGKYCEGWDRSAGSNRSSAEAEAGLFQSSYDSIGINAELGKLYTEYKGDTSRCMLDTFKVGSTCSSSNLSNLGSGAGADYQSFNKSCPAFAAEYAMTMLRIQRNHYGPINRKEAEVISTCNQMLKSVQDLVDDNVYACDDII